MKSTLFLRTDRAIIDAMIRLLKVKSFEQITVQNILDETPVTRATFYAHFKDKYDVAERMQDMFMEYTKAIPKMFETIDRTDYPKIIRKGMMQNSELTRALLQIHTDKVDIKKVISDMHREHYLSIAQGEDIETSANVYAEAMTAYYFSYFYSPNAFSRNENHYDSVMLPVFLHIFKLENDETLIKEIISRLPH